MADGKRLQSGCCSRTRGKPVEVVYPTEGCPLIIVPIGGVREGPPNPNAGAAIPELLFQRGDPANAGR